MTLATRNRRFPKEECRRSLTIVIAVDHFTSRRAATVGEDGSCAGAVIPQVRLPATTK